MRFSGNVALVTGASRGIGQAVAVQLAEMGFSLIVTARNIGDLAETIALCKKSEVPVAPHAVDFEKAETLGSFVSELLRSGTRVNVLVNNAGMFEEKPFVDTDEEDLLRNWKVNFAAPVSLVRSLLPILSNEAAAGRRAAVINIGSAAAARGYARGSLYAPMKSALRSFSEGLLDEVGGLGISVSVIEPGVVNTGMHAKSGRYVPELMIQPRDVAHTVRFIVEMPVTTCPFLVTLRCQRDPRVKSNETKRSL